MNDLWMFVKKHNLERVVNPRDPTIDTVPKAVDLILANLDRREVIFDALSAEALVNIISGVTWRGVGYVDTTRFFWKQVLAETEYLHQFAITLLNALWINMDSIEDIQTSRAWNILNQWLPVGDDLLLANSNLGGVLDSVAVMHRISEAMFGSHWCEIAGLGYWTRCEDLMKDILRRRPAFLDGVQGGLAKVEGLPLPTMDFGAPP